jgi:hypothetical protein
MGPVQSEQVFRSAVHRALAMQSRIRPVVEQDALLERAPSDGEAPQLLDAQPAEDATGFPRAVGGGEAVFGAFLDGAQRSFVAAWDGPSPIVAARVSAAIRARVDRRLVRWREPRAEWWVFADFSRTSNTPWEKLVGSHRLVDLAETVGGDAGPSVPHPLSVIERARTGVASAREHLERGLARLWCEHEGAPLYVDGGIGSEEAVARSPLAVGVIKSHRVLYASGAALELVLALGEGERSPAFIVAPRGRSTLLSWYLRLRPTAGRGGLWGLVRVEAAMEESGRVSARADTVSRWVLAETRPLALPDPRWDTMAYGVRGCEDYLRALG